MLLHAGSASRDYRPTIQHPRERRDSRRAASHSDQQPQPMLRFRVRPKHNWRAAPENGPTGQNLTRAGLRNRGSGDMNAFPVDPALGLPDPVKSKSGVRLQGRAPLLLLGDVILVLGCNPPSRFRVAATVAAWVRVMHSRKQPFPRRRDVDENPITDPGVEQTVRLIQPASHGANIAINLGSKRVEIEIVSEKIALGHFWHRLFL
jgi:hypothetical protein